MVEPTCVDNEEALYRSVRPNSDEYHYDSGKLQITYRAFQDKNLRPSVDRAKLRLFNPESSKLGTSDGIVTLIAQEVRNIGEVTTRVSDVENKKHAVDVIHRPENDNPSHSQIEVAPHFFGSSNKQDKAFKLLRISLARLATERGWTLEPNAESRQ